ncbi:MAG TPA: MobF family relaxase [Verrucomicrobiae bacterium]|jgi:conjugative relaxase-like TrwC/TraI family protein
MLRVVASVSAGQAKQYYTQGLSREDYYSEGQEVIGQWQGLGAERLGLSGRVDQRSFDALADNLKPGSDQSLTPRTKENRRVGYDFNFHCPKSVSVVYEHNRDERIFGAFKMSVTETMRELETDMKTRVRVRGENSDRNTGNLVWAEFHHFTARPVKGVPDPHLHAHCFAFNATWDNVEQRWKAGEFGDLKRDAPYYEAAFHGRFAKRLAEIGYDIVRTEKGREIAGVPQTVLDKFSLRTKQIEALAAERGITSAKEKDMLAALSRENKRHGITREQLRDVWNGRLTVDEKTALASVKADSQNISTNGVTAKQAMDYAIAHRYERASVATDKELLREALHYGVGSLDVGEVQRQLARDEFIQQESNGRHWFTTKEILGEEKKLIDFVREGKGVCQPLNGRGYRIQDEKLLRPEGREQREAVEHMLSSPDRVIAVRGGAGTGKTTMLKEAVAGIEVGGHKVFAFAPSAEASRGVLHEAGFENATTVAALLHSPKMQEDVRNGVLLVDEAGLLSSPQLKQVVELAQRQNCRVLLSGATAQHTAVERGDALRLLESHAGLRAAELKHIRRQLHPAYRAAVADLRQGLVENGFAKLNSLGAIKETSAASRYQQLAADYIQSVKDRKTALVVSPTHAEGERVTTEIRKELKGLKKLGPDERPLPQLNNLRWTEAQRADASQYQSGMVIQFHQNAPGFRRSEKVTVTDREQNQLTVQRADGTKELLKLGQDGSCRASVFNVYSAGVLPVAPGEWIRITQNGYSREGHRLNNGELRRVKGFDKAGDVVLDNGWVVPKDYGNLAHGYCVTSHGSQGKSVQRLLVAESEESLPAASREQFYVSASRGVEDIRIYTDDKNALMAAVLQSQQRPSATDLVKRTWPEHLNAKARRISQRRKQDALKQTKTRAKQEEVLTKEKTGRVEKIALVQKEKIVPPEKKQKNYHGISL